MSDGKNVIMIVCRNKKRISMTWSHRFYVHFLRLSKVNNRKNTMYLYTLFRIGGFCSHDLSEKNRIHAMRIIYDIKLLMQMKSSIYAFSRSLFNKNTQYLSLSALNYKTNTFRRS
jgi:hypothetical protein